MNEDELLKSFQQSLNLGAGGEGDGNGDFVPMMQNMMSNLLSKDILYPSLQDLAHKVTSWQSTTTNTLFYLHKIVCVISRRGFGYIFLVENHINVNVRSKNAKCLAVKI